MTGQNNKQQITFYQTNDGKVEIEVCLQDETVWLPGQSSLNWIDFYNHRAINRLGM